ncbi:hypothetical protein KSF78_0002557 [Schistosoma japonicum]|nr:hypothetical protein KSF78_0002557 [Schistosoma japonicum]
MIINNGREKCIGNYLYFIQLSGFTTVISCIYSIHFCILYIIQEIIHFTSDCNNLYCVIRSMFPFVICCTLFTLE